MVKALLAVCALLVLASGTAADTKIACAKPETRMLRAADAECGNASPRLPQPTPREAAVSATATTTRDAIAVSSDDAGMDRATMTKAAGTMTTAADVDATDAAQRFATTGRVTLTTRSMNTMQIASGRDTDSALMQTATTVRGTHGDAMAAVRSKDGMRVTSGPTADSVAMVKATAAVVKAPEMSP